MQQHRRPVAVEPNDALQRRMQSPAPPKAVMRNQIDTATLRAERVPPVSDKPQRRRMQSPAWVTEQDGSKAEADPLDTMPSMINWDGLMIFSGYSVNGKPLSMSDAGLM